MGVKIRHHFLKNISGTKTQTIDVSAGKSGILLGLEVGVVPFTRGVEGFTTYGEYEFYIVDGTGNETLGTSSETGNIIPINTDRNYSWGNPDSEDILNSSEMFRFLTATPNVVGSFSSGMVLNATQITNGVTHSISMAVLFLEFD